MLFPLKNLEAHIEDRFLIIGETLFEQGKVVDLVEAERHLWLANVVNREVEVQITPSKVRACTCECGNYKEAGICEHITAVLLKLRNEVDRIKDKQEKKRIKRNFVAKKLTTSIILENVSHEELKYFIRDFSKGNKSFGLALKARFAASVPMLDDRLKYYQLLDSAINDSRTTNDRILYKGKLKILKIIKELLAQTDDYIVSENFKDAFYILQAIIEKGSPLLNKIEGNSDKYFDEIKRAFSLLEALLGTDLAPGMREDIWLFCLNECTKTTYRLTGFTPLLFELLMEMSNDVEKGAQLLEVIDIQLGRLVTGGQREANLLVYKLALLEKEGREEEAEKVVLENMRRPNLLIFIAQKSIEKENYKRARVLIEKGMEMDFSNRVVFELEELLLIVAKAQKKKVEIKKYTLRRFLNKKEVEDFEVLKEIISKNKWASYLGKLLAELEQQPFSMSKRDIIAEIHFKENNGEALLDYIASIRSLDLLQRYDIHLLKEHKKQVAELYESILDSFIKHHLGRNSSEKIRFAIHHLYDIKADRIANKIVKNFRKNYPDRFTLMEELARF